MIQSEEDEVALVKSIIGHAAGFDMGIFGQLMIRSTDQATIEVEWDYCDSPQRKTKHCHKSFDKGQLDEACAFFVRLRREFGIGDDLDELLNEPTKDHSDH